MNVVDILRAEPLIALVIIPFFGAADRMVGGLGSRSVVFTLTMALGAWISWSFGSYVAVTMCGAWVFYRALPWAIGGTTTPRTPIQILGSLARHSWPMAVAWGIHRAGDVAAVLPATLAIYAVAATAMSIAYAQHVAKLARDNQEDDGSLNELFEVARGTLFGMSLAITALDALT